MTKIKPLVLKNTILSLGIPILGSILIFSALKANELFGLISQRHASFSSLTFCCLISIFSIFSLLFICRNRDLFESNDSKSQKFTRTASNWLFGLCLLPGILHITQFPISTDYQPELTLTILMFILSIGLGSFGTIIVRRFSNYFVLLVLWTVFVPMAFLSQILQCFRMLVLRC